MSIEIEILKVGPLARIGALCQPMGAPLQRCQQQEQPMPERLTVILPPVLSDEEKAEKHLFRCGRKLFRPSLRTGRASSHDDGWGDGIDGYGEGDGDGGINCSEIESIGNGYGDGYGYGQGNGGSSTDV
jgi:hypothetical protein